MSKVIISTISKLHEFGAALFDNLVLLDESFAFPWSHAKWMELKNSSNFEAVVSLDKNLNLPQGFILIEKYEDADLNKCCYIHKILTKTDLRKNGIASRMILDLKLQLQAENFSSIYLDVEQENTVARAFYAKHCFEDLFVKKKFYSNGDNAIYCMAKIN